MVAQKKRGGNSSNEREERRGGVELGEKSGRKEVRIASCGELFYEFNCPPTCL